MKLEKNKKKIIYGTICFTILAALLVVFGINSKDVDLSSKNNDDDTQINSSSDDTKTIYKAYYELYLGKDYSEKQEINNEADYIAIVNIDSLSASNWDSLNKEYVSPYTKGTAKVIKTLKGELPATINYRRLGAEISYNEWIKGDVDPEKLENITTVKENKKNIVVDSRMSHDIHLEVGKTYLVFMKQYSCCNVDNEYTIIAFEHGTRELQQQAETSVLSTQNIGSLKVKDNVTGNWVNLSDVVNMGEIK